MPVIQWDFLASNTGAVDAALAKTEAQAKRTNDRIAKASESSGQKAAQAKERAERAALDKMYAQQVRDLAKLERAEKASQERRLRDFKRIQEQKSKVAKQNSADLADFAKGLAGGAAGLVGGLALGGAGVAAGLVGSATRDALSLKERSAGIARNARGPNEKAVDSQNLAESFQEVALKHAGLKGNDIAEGAERFVAKTGDLQTYLNTMDALATASSATGASMGDLADTAAELSTKFDIKDMQGMQTILATLTFQGKQGAFEMKDMAVQMSALGAAAQSFGGMKGVKGMTELGGILQIARSANSSGAETATSVADMFNELKAKGTKTQFKMYNKDGSTRNINDILVDMISKTGGHNVAQKNSELTKLLGIRGIRAVNPLIATYNDTFQKTKGTAKQKDEAARDAVTKQLKDAQETTANFAEVQKDAADAESQASAKVASAFEKLQAAALAELVPALEAALPSITQLGTSAIPDIVSGMAGFAALVLEASDAVKAFSEALHPGGSEGAVEAGKKEADRLTEERKSLTEKQSTAMQAGDKNKVNEISTQITENREKEKEVRKMTFEDRRKRAKNAISDTEHQAEFGLLNSFTFGSAGLLGGGIQMWKNSKRDEEDQGRIDQINSIGQGESRGGSLAAANRTDGLKAADVASKGVADSAKSMKAALDGLTNSINAAKGPIVNAAPK